MKELKVGERVNLEVTETDKESCKGCFFDSKMFYCEACIGYIQSPILKNMDIFLST